MHLGRLLAQGAVTAAALVLVVAACGTSTSSGAAKEVTVIGTWAGDEQKASCRWSRRGRRRPGTRSSTRARATSTPSSRPASRRASCPTSPACPARARWREYASRARSSRSTACSTSPTYKAETAPALVELGKAPTASSYGVFIKAAVKGLIWYNPKVHDYAPAPPATWDDLQERRPTANKGDAEATWCVGLESGAASGWPGTDWIEDIVLRQAGPDIYNELVAGKPSGPIPRSRRRSRPTRRRRREHATAAPRRSIDHELRRRRRPAVHRARPAASFLHQASFITGFGAVQGARPAGPTTTSSPSRTSTPRTRAPSRAPATCSACSTTRRSQVADEVPRHRAEPRRSGSRPAARCRPTRTPRPTRTTSASGRPSCCRTPRSSCSTPRT